MSFMNIRFDDVIEEGWYAATSKAVERKQNQHGEYLLWRFLLSKLNAEVAGFSTISESTLGKAFKWASALNIQIVSKTGWDPDDVVERSCEVFVETYEDDTGRTKNKVKKVRPLK